MQKSPAAGQQFLSESDRNDHNSEWPGHISIGHFKVIIIQKVINQGHQIKVTDQGHQKLRTTLSQAKSLFIIVMKKSQFSMLKSDAFKTHQL